MDDDPTEPASRVSAAQRVAGVRWLRRQATEMGTTYVAAWVDACAALIDTEHGSAARALLHHLADAASAEAIFTLLAGGLHVRRGTAAGARPRAAGQVPPVLPWWAEYGTWTGPDGTPPPVFATETLDLGDDPAGWPPVTIAAFALGDAAPTVLVEVSGSGLPTQLEPGQARRMATALLAAAELVDKARADPGQSGRTGDVASGCAARTLEPVSGRR